MKGPFSNIYVNGQKDMSCCMFGSAGVRKEPGINQGNEVETGEGEEEKPEATACREMPKDKDGFEK